MSKKDDPRNKDRLVARGATLFTGSKKTEKTEKKVPRRPVNLDNVRITTRDIPDKKNEEELIKRLEAAGIETNAYKHRYLIRRIKARMSKLNITTYKEYMEIIKKSTLEIKELHESLSINVTRFFRNRDTFEVIRDEILPALIKNAKEQGRKEIKIWSAGCAVGAEPYSIAMIASDVVPSTMNVRVFASDVKEELLNIARYSTYSDQYVAEMHPFEIQSYFNINEHGEYQVKPHIKRLVSFTKVDLMKDSYPSGLDLILCRNVLIYIDRDAQNEIMSNFFQSLRPNGMVILGRTETLFVDWRKHINIVSTKHRIYQKIGETPESLPSMEFELKDKDKDYNRSRDTKVISSTHQQRLQELKDFRKTFEDRRKAWEDRIAESEKRDTTNRISTRDQGLFNRTSKFSDNKVVTTRSVTKRTSVSPKANSFTPSTRGGGALSSFRDSLKNSTSDTSNENLTGLVGKKSPEEVYRELKKLRERREKSRRS
ncbi:MAG: protein-glutamate O-methyltransferase CheR [Candidatus Heimdallarchaeota archaeon]|nr:protein-glutamate O-methyltransferase CheR [Candidatus Heimdallarchaeota archaeon]